MLLLEISQSYLVAADFLSYEVIVHVYALGTLVSNFILSNINSTLVSCIQC